MAVGQSKVLSQRTYGVTKDAADRSSPDSSGSPQLANGSLGLGKTWIGIHWRPIENVPSSEDYKRIAGSSLI
jgi:hypothetical protein